MEAPGTLCNSCITVAPIRQRKSRRLHGLEPEYKGYTEYILPKVRIIRRTMETKPAISQLHIRHPSVFSGDAGQDPNKWLKGFDRVAKYNRWDHTMCLANVYFYLDGTAQQWFENNEDKLNDWETFQEELKKTFGDRQRQIRSAEEQLKNRAQRHGEPTQSYIQSVLALCNVVNPNMTEADKITHLMKGIAEDMYQALLIKDVATTEEFIKWCQRIEEMQQRRVGRKKYDRLPNVVPMAVVEDQQDLASLIRQIVREELQQCMAAGTIRPSEHQIMAMDVSPVSREVSDAAGDEVFQTLAPVCPVNRTRREEWRRPAMTYAAAAKRQPMNRPTRPQPTPPVTMTPCRRTDVWRTEDNTPLCFHCGRSGHVIHYCRERRRVLDDYFASRRQPLEQSFQRHSTANDYC